MSCARACLGCLGVGRAGLGWYLGREMDGLAAERGGRGRRRVEAEGVYKAAAVGRRTEGDFLPALKAVFRPWESAIRPSFLFKEVDHLLSQSCGSQDFFMPARGKMITSISTPCSVSSFIRT
jgi:hypothetical protein